MDRSHKTAAVIYKMLVLIHTLLILVLVVVVLPIVALLKVVVDVVPVVCTQCWPWMLLSLVVVVAAAGCRS